MKRMMLTTAALIGGLAFAAAPALAQDFYSGPGAGNYGAGGYPGSKGYSSTERNAEASGGPGTHVGAMRTGSESNSQKVYGNHNGYAPGHY
jgi:hypothetical protein